MATLRSRVPVGSAQWVLSENEQAQELIAQEVEEFSYSVRNDLEWLNEHMGDIFSGRNINVTDVFKTPGKLRGKTPRTARKRNALEKRAPLSDLFAPNPQANPSPLHKSLAAKKNPMFQVAEDIENRPPASPSPRKSPNKPIGIGKENVDSGYHEPAQHGADVKQVATAALSQASTLCPSQESAGKSFAQQEGAQVLQDRDATEDSFVSAEEDLATKAASIKPLTNDDIFIDQEDRLPETTPRPAIKPAAAPEEPDVVMEDAAEDNETMDDDGAHTPSDGSSPVKPLLRKSSLTFAALPGREPHGKSIGGRVSGANPFNGRSSQFGRFTSGKSLGGMQLSRASNAPASDHLEVDDAPAAPSISPEELEATRIHHKTSTQRLADKINMLGQSKEPRPSKSITFSAQPQYPTLPSNSVKEPSPQTVPTKDTSIESEPVEAMDEDEDDWIVPVKSKPLPEETRPSLFKTRSTETIKTVVEGDNPFAQMPIVKASTNPTSTRPGFFGHAKSVSSSAVPSPLPAQLASEASPKKAFSVSNPDLRAGLESTTPVGSPTTKRFADGPLSASKAKLYSVLKSAKGIFASSAGISAQAKMEALAPMPSPRREQPIMEEGPLSPNLNVQPSFALYPNLDESIAPPPPPKSPVRAPEGRRLRSSAERERAEKRKEKEERDQQKMEAELQKAREKESQKATAQKVQQSKIAGKAKSTASSIRSGTTSRAESETERNRTVSADETASLSKSQLPTSQISKTREPRKLFKPSRENLKTRPAPVSIKLASQRIGQLQPSTAALSASLHDSLAPSSSKQPGVSSKASNPSLHSSSSSASIRGRPKALEAAMKKKEADEKAAQRKAEQKRELEQRRQAKAEEERRLEQQRKASEAERAQQARLAAQKKAEEARRRQEQQRKDAMRPPSRPGNDLAAALQQEKLQVTGPHPRSDLNGPRLVGGKPVVPHVNPAKPPKRPVQEADEETAPRLAPRQGPPYQQLDAKRRKTNEYEDEEVENRRSVLAPPIRQSNIRKEPSKFTHGYVPATQAPSHAPSMFKSTVTGQHAVQNAKPNHVPDNSKFASGRIPFADAPNPPAGPSTHTAPSYTTQQYKTPARPAPAVASSCAITTGKSSPAPGESIALPEIATDSEDEDSDNEFVAPSWVESPALNQLLQQQQLVDPEAIFGPIPQLQMEEVFRNKDRHKRFRDRTSSANWSGNDRLTEEERRRDREARERLVREGAWSFQQNR